MKPRISVSEAMETAEVFAKSGYFNGNVYQLATLILGGVPRGLTPFDAVQEVHIISGRIAMSAGLIARLIKSNPLYNYRVTNSSPTICSIEFFERESPVDEFESLGTFTFTIEDARRAGVGKAAKVGSKSNIEKYPEQMLFARCLTSGARMHVPAALDGVSYTPEELGAEDEDEQNIAASDEPPTATTTEPTPYQERQNLMAHIKKIRADHRLSVADLKEIAKQNELPPSSSNMSIPELRTFVRLLQANAAEDENTVAKEPTENLVLASQQVAFEDDDYD